MTLGKVSIVNCLVSVRLVIAGAGSVRSFLASDLIHFS
jgi:hypothetical protein